MVWFDRIKEADWRVNSSTPVLLAWRAVVSAPLYGGSGFSAEQRSMVVSYLGTARGFGA